MTGKYTKFDILIEKYQCNIFQQKFIRIAKYFICYEIMNTWVKNT